MKTLAHLPNIETVEVLRASLRANKALAELKGLARTIPNQHMLISTLSLQEAKASSEIENIITTHDELYRSNAKNDYYTSINAKEVHRYAQAMQVGFEAVQNTGLLTANTIINIQQTLEKNRAGLRTQAGTQLKNEGTGQVIYTPPQDAQSIIHLMSDLERFINDPDYRAEFDDLVKMAIIHHQFESIHPFYDGNGRTGRIINVLFLVKRGLLGSPILYLSRYINHHKQDYYRMLQMVRDTGEWHDWVLFILAGIDTTARQTQELILSTKSLMAHFKRSIKAYNDKMYSHELINTLFKYPYTKSEFLVNDLGVHRNTANKYLNELAGLGLVTKQKIGKENFYINHELFGLLTQANQSVDVAQHMPRP